MCGIVAGISERNVTPILLEGLKRLEYRGYDSAGLAVVDDGLLHRYRTLGKVARLAEKLAAKPLVGALGIAHTRWATHGVPSERNAHPHSSCDLIAVVCNGIIENAITIGQRLQAEGYDFTSETDSEVIAHLIHAHYIENGRNLRAAVGETVKRLQGAFAFAVLAADRPDELIATRRGSPMVVGIGIGEHFLASDSFALLPVTRRFIYLQDEDLVVLTRENYRLFDGDGNAVGREVRTLEQDVDIVDKGEYKHFMEKEMFEQPRCIAATLEGRLHHGALNSRSFPPALLACLGEIEQIDIIACGTSYHAGLVSKFHFEKDGIRSNVEYASEYLYREVAVGDNTLFVCISQSGETADTLAALEKAKTLGYRARVAVCNVPDSALARACENVILTHAGREIGVASTKAFVTQLTALHMLNALLQEAQGTPVNGVFVEAFLDLPGVVERMLALSYRIEKHARRLRNCTSCLFLGRGEFFAIAAEGALKLKELSYIHAEAYPSGELKHGPLALVDENMPVVAVVKADRLADKVIANLREVQARGGQLIVFCDSRVDMRTLEDNAIIIALGELEELTASIAAVIPLQLFAYHVALCKGTDVDQPRNLAKSVTVE